MARIATVLPPARLVILGAVAAHGPFAIEVPPGLEQAVPIPMVAPELKPYDCDAEADIWEWAWTPDWKAWCCQHELKGCPSTTSKTSTQSATATQTETSTSTATETATSTTATASETKTETVAITAPQTESQTRTKTHTQTQTRTATTTDQETTEAPTQAMTTHQQTTEAPIQAKTTQRQMAEAPTKAKTTRQQTTEAPSQPSTKAPVPTDAATTTSATGASTVSLLTPSTESSTTNGNDLACNSDCVILGEHATCQSRISWVEEHQTQDESAPCPAAHVVVMSQCTTCGTCMFKDVQCASSTGVSKSLGDHTFMYRKYSEDPAAAAKLGAHAQPTNLSWISTIASFGFVPLLVVASAALCRRRRVEIGLDMVDQGISDQALIGEE